MLYRGIHHVAIAVRNLSESLKTFSLAMGLPVSREATVPDQGVRAALLTVGPDEIELLEPTHPAGGVARFLEKKGEGIHHLCIETNDVATALGQAKAANLPLIDQAPRPGLAGTIGFLHPGANQGLLIELAQPAHGTHTLSIANDAIFEAVETVLIGAKDAEGLAAILAKNFEGTAAKQDGPFGNSQVVSIGKSRVTVLDSAGLAENQVAGRVLGGKTEGFLGVWLKAKNMNAATKHFEKHSVPIETVNELIGSQANGVAVFFSA